MRAERVYLHIGLPKTGTTFVQETLWASKEALAGRGVLVPGESHLFQRFAVWDLLGRRLRGVDQPGVPGSWQALVSAVRQWDGASVVLSEEFLVNARPAQVRKIVDALAPAEVHVVVTVRDLARVLASHWQQEIAKGRTWTWPAFVAAVREPEQGAATAGVAFWLRHDLRRILTTWESAVEAERMHVVVVPGSESGPAVLLDRFAAACGLELAALTPAPAEANTSVGAAEVEVLRRLNVRLDGRLNERQHTHVMTQLLRPALRTRTSGPVRLSPDDHAWAAAHSRELGDWLVAGAYDVVGDPADLVPGVPSGAESASPDDVADAAMDALTASVERYATQWWRGRGRRAATGEQSPGSRVRSAGRALGYRTRAGALERADRSRVLGKAAALYLRVRSRRG